MRLRCHGSMFDLGNLGACASKLRIGILGVFYFLIQVEAQPILAFVADRQIGKDEVTCKVRTIKICDSSHGRPSENGKGGLCIGRNPTLCDWPSIFQRGVKKEIRIVRKGDVVLSLPFQYPQLHNWRRIHGTTVGRSYFMSIWQEQLGPARSGTDISLPSRRLLHVLAAE